MLYLFIIVLHNILSPNDKVHAILAVTGKTIKPIPVMDRIIEVDVAAIITIESTDSNIVFRVLYFLYFICFMIFIYERCDHFFNVAD